MLMVPRIYVNQELEICEIETKLLKRKLDTYILDVATN